MGDERRRGADVDESTGVDVAVGVGVDADGGTLTTRDTSPAVAVTKGDLGRVYAFHVIYLEKVYCLMESV